MANTLTAILPKILVRILPTLRNQCVMPRLVNRGYEQEKRQKGKTVTIPIPQTQSVDSISPAAYGPSPSDQTPTTTELTVDQWKGSSFYLTDQDLNQIEADMNFIPGQLGESVSELCNTINLYMLNLYKGVYGWVGNSGTTPFQTNARAITGAKKVLDTQKCPMGDRFAVLDGGATEEALNLSSFADASQTMENRVKIEGQLGRKYGFDFYTDNQVVSHTAGTDAGAATINSATVEPVGETTWSLKAVGGTLALKEGDIITKAGDSQTYVVDADVTITSGNTGNVVVAPGNKVATTGDEAITIKATHVVNLAFNRMAFGFVNAEIDDGQLRQISNRKFQAITDPVTGLTVRLEIHDQYKRTAWEIDALYGGALIQAERACRIAG